MAQKDNELLLKVLCAMLPYEVIVKDRNATHTLSVGNTEFADLFSGKCNIRPYLRPMSSMTEGEVKELLKVHIITKYGEDSDYYKNLIRIERISMHDNNSWSAWIAYKRDYDEFTTCFIIGRVTWETTINEIDWLNKNHFDYCGLIPRGLALEAPEGMYK